MKETENNNEATQNLLPIAQIPPPLSASKKSIYFMLFIGLQLVLIVIIVSLVVKSVPAFPHYGHYYFGGSSSGGVYVVEENVNVTMNWHKIPNRMEHLNMNPVYAKLGIPRKIVRPKVNLLLIVSSAPSRLERRIAIRDTWWNQSKSDDKVKEISYSHKTSIFAMFYVFNVSYQPYYINYIQYHFV